MMGLVLPCVVARGARAGRAETGAFSPNRTLMFGVEAEVRGPPPRHSLSQEVPAKPEKRSVSPPPTNPARCLVN
jgi:hypothetical protein